MSVPALADSRRWLTAGTDLFLEQIASADLAASSLLPGWSNAHVVAHVARNADAVGRLLIWARTGVETPMYASPEDRVSEIERDAHRGDDVLLADARHSATAFAAAVDSLDAAAWQAHVRTARGRLIHADEVPWMRVKEVWLHAVDVGAPIDTLPDDLLAALMTDIAAAFDAKVPPPSLRLRGTAEEWVIGAGGLTVTGSPSSLLAWLTGRSAGGDLSCDEPLPALPPWL